MIKSYDQNCRESSGVTRQIVAVALISVAGGGLQAHAERISPKVYSESNDSWLSIRQGDELASLKQPELSSIEPKKLRSIAEKLEVIKSVLGLSVSQISRIVNVSRQSIYKWQSGEPVSPEYSKALDKLDMYAHVFADAGIKNAGPYLRANAFDGTSLLEQLLQNQNFDFDIDEFVGMVTTADKAAIAHRQSKVGKSKGPTDDHWMVETSMPVRIKT